MRLAVAVAGRPRDFAGGSAAPDGGPGWLVFGELYPTNPRLLLDDEATEMLRLFRLYGREMGPLMPEAGGVMDQSAAMLDAFSLMRGAELELEGD